MFYYLFLKYIPGLHLTCAKWLLATMLGMSWIIIFHHILPEISYLKIILCALNNLRLNSIQIKNILSLVTNEAFFKHSSEWNFQSLSLLGYYLQISELILWIGIPHFFIYLHWISLILNEYFLHSIIWE